MREQLLVILGPTACGKTGVSIALAKRRNGEVVSADSVAVYRGMAIGSARPGEAERQGVRHHLLDCVDCGDADFSVARFKALAIAAIDDILSRNRLPILVGGSGLYIDAVTAPMTYASPNDPLLREKLNGEYLRDPAAFHARLRAVDPVTADRLHGNDQRRLVRAMEIYLLTGKPMSAQTGAYAAQQGERGRYSCRKIGLAMQRAELYRRIDARVDRMMADGLMEEARLLYERGLPRDLPAMKSIGYAQLFAYFDGSTTLDETVAAIKRDTRRLAKRQITWFKRDPNVTWFRWEDYESAAQLEQAVIETIEGNTQ